MEFSSRLQVLIACQTGNCYDKRKQTLLFRLDAILEILKFGGLLGENLDYGY